MSSFQNKDIVYNQVGGTQNNYGPVYFGTVPKDSETVDPVQSDSTDGSSGLANLTMDRLIPHSTELLASLAFPQMLERRNNIEAAHPATCQWILRLEEFKTWKSQPRGFLWIKGKPGVGKSTVMAYLYDVLKAGRQQQDVQLDFFFSARGSILQRTPLGVLRSLLNQLFIQAPCIRSPIRHIYNEKQNAFGRQLHSWKWQQRELEQMLQVAIVTAAIEHPITIFVDALDEAGETSAREMAKYFHSIFDRVSKSLVSVKLCISCRHYPIIGPLRCTEIYIENHNSADIAAYIHDCLDLSYIESDQERAVWTEMETDLLQRANGVFQWVYLLVQLINKKIADGESPSDVRKALQQVPQELGDVYHYILQSVIDEKHRKTSLCLFRWICFAQRPLSVTEIRYALACSDAEIGGARYDETSSFTTTDTRMKLRLKALSGGLVEATYVLKRHYTYIGIANATSESVQVIHQSVTDFLRSRGLWLLEAAQRELSVSSFNSGPSCEDQRETIYQSHQMLYKSCLLYLDTELKQAMSFCKDTRKDISSELLGTWKRWGFLSDNADLIATRTPLISYAVTNLYIHFGRARMFDSGYLQTQSQFMQRIISDWTAIYNLIAPWSEQCPRKGATLLHVASTAGLADLVRSLVHNPAHIQVKDCSGNTALHVAAKQGHGDVVTILIEAGAKVDAQNQENQTPLVLAAGAGWVDIVQQLLSHGSRLNYQDEYLETALCAAVQRKQCEMMKVLLAAGADIDAHGGKYGNALQTAAALTDEDDIEVVQILLDAGAEVDALGGIYGNALQVASWFGNDHNVRVLLAAGADVNALNEPYGTALQAAVVVIGRRSEKVQKTLLNAGANVNARGGMFGNALIAAAHKSSKKTVQVLLAAGADVNARDERYGSALQAALRRGSRKIARILRGAGADEETELEKFSFHWD